MGENIRRFSSEPPSPSEDSDPSFAIICEIIGSLQTDTTIVDYGCAYGNFGIKGLVKFLDVAQLKLIEYIGVDIDEEKLLIVKDMPELEEFKQKIRKEPQFIKVSDYFKLTDSMADFIVCSRTLHDVRLTSLYEVFYHNLRVLKRGGSFIFYDKGSIEQDEETNAVIWDLEDFQRLFFDNTSVEVRFWPKYPIGKNRKEIHVELIKREELIPDLNYFYKKCIEIYEIKSNKYDELLTAFEEKEKLGLYGDADFDLRNFYRMQYASLQRQIKEFKEIRQQSINLPQQISDIDKLKEFMNQSEDLKNYLGVIEKKDVEASVEQKQKFHSIVPLSWDYIIASADSKRDVYDEIWPEVQNEKQEFRFFLIYGEPLSGKSTLMRRIGFDLVCQNRIVLQALDVLHVDKIWNRIPKFFDFLSSPICILIDDIFDNDESFKILRGLLNEGAYQDIGITIIGTAILSPFVQRRLNDLHKTGCPTFSKEIKLTDGDKQRILKNVDLDPYSIDNRSLQRLMAINRFYTFLAQAQLAKGIQFQTSEMIPSETAEEWRLKKLMEQQPRLYEAYKYICFVNRFNVAIPLSIIQKIENSEFSDLLDIKGHEDWVFKSETHDPHIPVLEAAHWFLAKIYWEIYVQSKSPKNILDELTTVASTNNPFEEIFILHIFRTCVNESPSAYKPILQALSEKINKLQGAIGVDHLLIWQRIYLKLGMKRDAERCLNEAKTREPVNSADLLVQIGLIKKADPVKVLELFEKGLAKYPDNRSIKVGYLNFLSSEAARFPEYLRRVFSESADWLRDLGENSNVTDAFIDAVIAHAPKLIPDIARMIRQWLIEYQDHYNASIIWASYLKLLQHNSELTENELIDDLNNCFKWLLIHRKERGYAYLMPFYVSTIKKYGTNDQKGEALKELLGWLGKHPKAGHIWYAYFDIVDSVTDEGKNIHTIIDINSVIYHIKEIGHPNTIVKLLDLIEKWGAIADKRKIINRLHDWLEDALHWDDSFVRARYVRFVGNWGTEYQADRTFEQNKRWFNDFNDNQDVRTAHLTFIEKRRQANIDVEIEEGEQWLIVHPNAESVRQKIDSMKRRKQKQI